MKTDYFFIIILISVQMFWGCSSTKITTNKKPDSQEVVDLGYSMARKSDIANSPQASRPNENGPSNRSLEDMIRGLFGVTVTGSGNNLKIRISGVGSFSDIGEPLFVVNGSATSMDYAQLAATIIPNEITYISALKGPDASIYGSRGANGVILIRTK